jgi:hypothetical protein
MSAETFTCGRCGGTWPKVNSDEDAMAEAVENFGVVINPVVVCDDCYHEFMDWFREDPIGEAISRTEAAIHD